VSGVGQLALATFSNWEHLRCCALLPVGRCIILLLAWLSIVMNFVMWFIIYVQCLALWPKVEKAEEIKHQNAQKKYQFLLFFVYFLFFVACTFVSLYYTVILDNIVMLSTIRTILVVIASATLGFVWLPQIYTTFKAKDPGSLSLLMLVLTCPGSYAMTYFLAVGYDTPLYVWLPNALGSLFQTVLLALCIYYSYIKKWLNKTNTITENKSLIQ